MQELGEPHRLREEPHPAFHLAPLDVRHDVVDGREPDVASRQPGTAARFESRGKHAVVAVPLHELDHGVAVGVDGRRPQEPVLVAFLDGRRRADGPAAVRFREGASGIGNLQRDDRHAVSMGVGEAGGRPVGRKAAREDEPNRPAFQDVRRRLAAPGFEAAVGHDGKSEAVLVERRRLPRVSDVELDVVDLPYGKAVSHGPASV